MKLTGQSLIAGSWMGEQGQKTFYPYLPATNSHSDQHFFSATEIQLELAAKSADAAFKEYRKTSTQQRANFLRTIADQILELGDGLLEVTHQETGLPIARLEGERMRTVNQLRLFSNELLYPTDPAIQDSGDPDRVPTPKPFTRLEWLPIGPVAMFGASNFPYAFSTLGGDTASALAAGCPVVVKAHPAHPGTCELMAHAISEAINLCNLPQGVFSQVQSFEPAIAHKLVAHPAIKAVGFTGSHQVASQLQQTIYSRPEPIPFYGELGSVNPQIVFQEKAQLDGAVLAEQICQALLMGNGQFCTSPGVWVIPSDATDFLAATKAFIRHQGSDTLLTQGILESYDTATTSFAMNDQLSNFASGKLEKAFHAATKIFLTTASTFTNNKQLQQEIFGPCALIVTYKDESELQPLIDSIDGQLTACVHGTEEDFNRHQATIEALTYKVGRLIFNQMPTGVEVCASMNHGGPYPASTDVRSTSVGLQAMKRFIRPICYQNMPSSINLSQPE